jgi:hypothetical protein
VGRAKDGALEGVQGTAEVYERFVGFGYFNEFICDLLESLIDGRFHFVWMTCITSSDKFWIQDTGEGPTILWTTSCSAI